MTNENRLFIAGLDGVIYSLDASSGRVSCKRKLSAAPSTGLALRDKTIYVGTNDQSIYRLNAETGTAISELATEARPVGRMAFANDSLFMFLEKSSERVGDIISVDSKLAGVRWEQRSSPGWASERPHLAHLLIRKEPTQSIDACRILILFVSLSGRTVWFEEHQCVSNLALSRVRYSENALLLAQAGRDRIICQSAR